MDNPGVVRGSCSGEQIKSDAEPTPTIEELLMIFSGYFLRILPLLLSPESYRRPMLVAA